MRHIMMPQVSEEMQEATLLNWCIKEGDTFQEGDIIFEIETEKVAFEVEAPFSGKLRKILVSDGATVGEEIPLAEAEEESV